MENRVWCHHDFYEPIPSQDGSRANKYYSYMKVLGQPSLTEEIIIAAKPLRHFGFENFSGQYVTFLAEKKVETAHDAS